MNKLYAFLFIFILTYASYGQIGIGNTNPDASSALDISANNAGILIPRISLISPTDVSTITSPAPSLLIYNTNTTAVLNPGYYYWNGLQWTRIVTADMISNKWDLAGNSGTDHNIHFLGTR